MAVTAFQQLQATDTAPPRAGVEGLAAALLREQLLPTHELLDAIAQNKNRRGRLVDNLLARGLVDEDRLYTLVAQVWGVSQYHATDPAPDPRLIDQFGAVNCLTRKLLPCRRLGDSILIATSSPEDFPAQRPQLEDVFGPVLMAVTPARVIEAAVLTARGAQLAQCAETRVAHADSCRSYRPEALHIPAVLCLIALTVIASLWPGPLLLVATLIALLAGLAFTGLKVVAGLAALQPPPPEIHPAPEIARLPVVSIMVALYRESNIAARLVKRLNRLDYPRELLDVLLVVEAEDTLTRAALAKAGLPGWMRIVIVPDGAVKTKPRALNFALDHCRGTIVGVYDAEDAPEPDQISKVVARFHRRGPDLACLQGRLDFYNPRINWFSRCFTIEYAAWFRLLLPGIERLGLAVPLGGTTLFFRRTILEDLGRWDAHNVTEDADLGMRIARRGYRTELLDTTTFEEANCRPGSWIKQRSRWIKGFMMTWATHMRDPVLLWRELGPRRFLGFQLLLAGSVLQSLLAPVLWSFWLVPMGFSHPVVGLLSPSGFATLWHAFLLIEVLTMGFGIAGSAKTRHRLNPLWVPTLIFYYPMATFAAYKALWEMLVQPFYWDKTSHGEFDHIT